MEKRNITSQGPSLLTRRKLEKFLSLVAPAVAEAVAVLVANWHLVDDLTAAFNCRQKIAAVEVREDEGVPEDSERQIFPSENRGCSQAIGWHRELQLGLRAGGQIEGDGSQPIVFIHLVVEEMRELEEAS